MPLPNCPDKHDAPAVLTPADHVEHLPVEADEVPETVLLAFQSQLVEEVSEGAERSLSFTEGRMHVFEAGRVGLLGGFGIGSAVTAAVVDQLWALGVETVAILGGCGSLQPDVHGEEALVIEEAIRDEGASHHYLEPGRTVAATAELVERFETALRDAGIDHRVGPTWTTDAIYRETVPEVEQYASDGVLGVEMEVATLFAVARYRGLEAGAVLVAFDALTAEEWTPLLDGERRLERLLPVVTGALLDGGSR